MSNNYQWQGESVKVEFGNCTVSENKEKPLWWYNFECNSTHPKGGACVEALRITAKDGYQFIISNHFGVGVHKLLNGGWPNYTHFSLSDDFSTKPRLKIDKFDLDGYSNHEGDRRKWQKENYPEAYAKIERLEKLMPKH